MPEAETSYPTAHEIRKGHPDFDKFNLDQRPEGLKHKPIDTIEAREAKDTFATNAQELGDRALDHFAVGQKGVAEELYTRGRYHRDHGDVVGNAYDEAAETGITARAANKVPDILDGITGEIEKERAEKAERLAALEAEVAQLKEELKGYEDVRDNMFAATDQSENAAATAAKEAELARQKLDDPRIQGYIEEARNIQEHLGRN